MVQLSRFRGPPSKVPTWIVVDNESELLMGEREPPPPSRRSKSLDRDRLIKEILDGRPLPHGHIVGSVPPPPPRRSRSFEDPPSPSSFEVQEKPPRSPSRCSVSVSRKSRHSSTTTSSTTRSSSRALNIAAPLFTCLTSKRSYDDGQPHYSPEHAATNSTDSPTASNNSPSSLADVGSEEILNDLEKDPRMNPAVMKLPDYLRFGVVVVQGASLESVNGVYRCTSQTDSVGHYTKAGYYNRKGKRTPVKFSIFRCMHASNSRRWYLSICSSKYAPGTKYDTDLYAALATGIAEEIPPLDGWRVVVGSGVPGNAPLTMWIPHEARIKTCSVCLSRPVSHVLVPCGHACLCEKCAVRCTRCPEGFCRVDKVIRLFGSISKDTPLARSKSSTRAAQMESSTRVAQLVTPTEFGSQPQVLPVTQHGFRRVVL